MVMVNAFAHARCVLRDIWANCEHTDIIPLLAQVCPDTKSYSSSESNFCSATAKDENECAENVYPPIPHPTGRCLLQCYTDRRCTTVRTSPGGDPCDCGCQVSSQKATGADVRLTLPPCHQLCPDNNYYGITSNYKKSDPIDRNACDVFEAKDVCHEKKKKPHL